MSQFAGPGDSPVGKAVVSILQGRVSRARWATGHTSSSVQQGGASGGWCQGRSAWHRTALWCVELGYFSSSLEPASVTPWKCHIPPLSVFLINISAPLMPSVEFPQEPMGGTWLFCLTLLIVNGEFPQEPSYGWSPFADVVVRITCADLGCVSLPDVPSMT